MTHNDRRRLVMKLMVTMQKLEFVEHVMRTKDMRKLSIDGCIVFVDDYIRKYTGLRFKEALKETYVKSLG